MKNVKKPDGFLIFSPCSKKTITAKGQFTGLLCAKLIKYELVFPLLIADLTSFMRNFRSGFTILEIMVVVALIGLLTAIVVPHVLKARDRANQKSCISNLRQIDQAIQLWATDTKSLSSAVVNHTNLVPYLRKLPSCPAAKNGNFNSDYGMTFVEDPSFCKISSSLASMPHSLNPGILPAVAISDSQQTIATENFPKPRKRN